MMLDTQVAQSSAVCALADFLCLVANRVSFATVFKAHKINGLLVAYVSSEIDARK
jgi:hypothetical protein